MTLKKIGLYVILIGLALKVLLQNVYPNGILIDLCRLSFYVGLAMFIIGFVKGRKRS